MKVDTQSPTWHFIETWAQDFIDHNRDRLEMSFMPPETVQQIRGECRALRLLLSHGRREEPAFSDSPITYSE